MGESCLFSYSPGHWEFVYFDYYSYLASEDYSFGTQAQREAGPRVELKRPTNHLEMAVCLQMSLEDEMLFPEDEPLFPDY